VGKRTSRTGPTELFEQSLPGQGDAPLRARPLRGRLGQWLAGLNPDDHTLMGTRRDELPDLTHEDAGAQPVQAAQR
jgi:hypothetical protein